mmetsp:Transcript_63225/g.73996  ORF Transcript_63225/g.73996 Transcript_63225/m.73996 type:complete len:201 (-) Transcript_63225:526-1128(-)
MATAVSPSMVSKRVVATTSFSSEFSMGYAKEVNTPNSYRPLGSAGFPICVFTFKNVRPSRSTWSTSISLIADLSAQLQFPNLLARYSNPRSWKILNASTTALLHFSSIVNRSLLQSTEDPRERSWVVILPPYSSFHSHTFSMNFSRPRSCLVCPLSFMSIFSTMLWVAIPAWSVPGMYKEACPFILCQRVKVSSTAAVNA